MLKLDTISQPLYDFVSTLSLKEVEGIKNIFFQEEEYSLVISTKCNGFSENEFKEEIKKYIDDIINYLSENVKNTKRETVIYEEIELLYSYLKNGYENSLIVIKDPERIPLTVIDDLNIDNYSIIRNTKNILFFQEIVLNAFHILREKRQYFRIDCNSSPAELYFLLEKLHEKVCFSLFVRQKSV